MAEQSLKDLEAISASASADFYQDYEKVSAAEKKAEAADAAYKQALNDMAYDEYGSDYKEKQEAFNEALKAKQKADAELDAANDAAEKSAAAAQDAAEAVEAKKEALRKSRSTDVSMVVHCARIECSCATKESYLVLKDTHGVYTRQIPQTIITDYVLDDNIIHFDGCKSKENPTVIAAAEKEAADAQAQIKAKEGWRDKAMNKIFGEKEIEVTDSLLEQCVGKCIAKFPKGACWKKKHEKVTINGESPILRRCEIDCNYGGKITILMSGQPE